ncbi:hypothetical protein L7F22_037675 [Adiantum nelumboides]|nr:hypothetical protein [Adiantum nelumboides]
MASGEGQSNPSTSGDAGRDHHEDYGDEYGPKLVDEATNLMLNFAKDPKLAKYMSETAFQDEQVATDPRVFVSRSEFQGGEMFGASFGVVMLPNVCQNRWVETVPLAAEMLDLRRSQKLNMVETLKMERQRVRFEAAIGKAPPLNDDELLDHVRDKAIELRDELRLENRKAFGNIWADILAGITVFLLLVFNPDRVAIMRLTGNRLFTNISDTGKAFIIILLSDIFLGYHSESGWETLVEIVLEHYGFEADKAYVYLFVAIVPVTIDACFKLWVFRFLTRLSPSAAATFKEMQRH